MFALTMISLIVEAEVITVNGVYQGKDVYVTNPTTSSGVGFCIFEVLVNNQPSKDEVNPSSFAVDLRVWGFKKGDPVQLVFRCKEKCDVRLVNPESFYPTSTFNIESIKLSNEGLLEWITTKEGIALPYYVEQFRWNKWINVGEALGIGEPVSCKYSIQVNLTSGLNIFRVLQTDWKGQHYSQEVRIESPVKAVGINNVKFGQTLELTAETDYELYSEFGNLVLKGRGQSINTAALSKGVYYLSYDNKPGVRVERK
ncbi:MAG: hypothetical protein ACKOZY_06855 [Flavobacteriales bacterium]